jgi:long-chain acyl-CoA synthetase
MFYDRVAETPAAEAYRYPTDDGWESVTWGETGEKVRTYAAGLLALGILPQSLMGLCLLAIQTL